MYGNAQGITVAYSGTNNQVYNNTVYGNELDGIAMTLASATVVRNNIVYGNSGGGITDNDNGTRGAIITNNLTADPLFVNASGNDFSL